MEGMTIISLLELREVVSLRFRETVLPHHMEVSPLRRE
jgi:hypothetical protein